MPLAIRVALGSALALLVWAAISWVNSDSRQINRELDELRSLVTKRPAEAPLESLSRATSIGSMFANSFEVRAEQLQLSTRDRRTLVGSIIQYRSTSDSIFMNIRDHDLFVDSNLGRATSNLKAEFNNRFGGLDRRESYQLQLNWVETQDGWRIDYVHLIQIQGPQ